MKCHLIYAVFVLGVGLEARNRITLEHERDNDSHAAGEDNGSDQGNASSKLVYSDAPVGEKSPDLDDYYSERPERYKDVETLDWLVGECEREWGRYDLKSSDIAKLLSGNNRPQRHM